MYLTLEGGKKSTMPRYYKEKIFDKWERKYYGEQLANELKAKEWKDAQVDPNYWRNKAEAARAAKERIQFQLINQKI